MSFRELFSTPRAATFTDPIELETEVGFAARAWPAVVLKELSDNALDGAEDCGRPPVLDLALEDDGEVLTISVADNGTGYPAEAVRALCDLAQRTSSRAAFATLSRGAQGQAMQTILGMAYCAASPPGSLAEAGVTIEARGIQHSIRITRGLGGEPTVLYAEEASCLTEGTRVTVKMAVPALYDDDDARALDRMVMWLRLVNPGATINGLRIGDPRSARWSNDQRPPVAWASLDRLAALAAAMIVKGRETGRMPAVRDLVTKFAGMTSAPVVSRVLKAGNWARIPLDVALVTMGEDGGETVDRDKLRAIKATIVGAKDLKMRPRRLGVLGRSIFDAWAAELSAEVMAYEKAEVDDPHTPAVIEVAVIDAESVRFGAEDLSAITINNSSPVASGRWRVAGRNELIVGESKLADSDPYAVIASIVTPCARWRGRAKADLAELPDAVEDGLRTAVRRATKSLKSIAKRIERQTARMEAAETMEAEAEAKAERRAWQLRLRNDRLSEDARKRRDREMMEELRLEILGPAPDVPEVYRPLANRIETVLAEHGGVRDDWLVLSPGADPYAKVTGTSLRQGAWFGGIVSAMPKRIEHMRGAHYFVASTPGMAMHSATPYHNTAEAWRYLLRAGHDARWLGFAGFGRIVDQRSDRPHVPVINGHLPRGEVDAGAFEHQTITADLPRPRIKLGTDARDLALYWQPWTLVVITEKASVVPLISHLMVEMGVVVCQPIGNLSESMVWDIASLIERRGKPAVIAYLADADPSGFGMSAEVARKLQALADRGDVTQRVIVHHAAVTIEQARRLGLPSAPFKVTERRADKWTAATGVAQIEIDAMLTLHPEEVVAAATDIFTKHFDGDLEARIGDALTTYRGDLDDHLEGALAAAGWSPDLEAARLARREANRWITRFNAAVGLPPGLLDDLDLPDFDPPPAEVEASGQPIDLWEGSAIYDSAASWTANTIRLRSRKKTYDAGLHGGTAEDTGGDGAGEDEDE